jgi:chromosome segregation ATPase
MLGSQKEQLTATVNSLRSELSKVKSKRKQMDGWIAKAEKQLLPEGVAEAAESLQQTAEKAKREASQAEQEAQASGDPTAQARARDLRNKANEAEDAVQSYKRSTATATKKASGELEALKAARDSLSEQESDLNSRVSKVDARVQEVQGLIESNEATAMAAIQGQQQGSARPNARGISNAATRTPGAPVGGTSLANTLATKPATTSASGVKRGNL